MSQFLKPHCGRRCRNGGGICFSKKELNLDLRCLWSFLTKASGLVVVSMYLWFKVFYRFWEKLQRWLLPLSPNVNSCSTSRVKQPHAQDFSLKNGSGGKSPGYQVALNAVEDVPPVYPWEFEEFDSSEYLLFYHIHFSLGYCQFVQILCVLFL